MYNRYIPQPDGSFRRNRMEDRSRPPEKPPQEHCPPPPPEPCREIPKPSCNSGPHQSCSYHPLQKGKDPDFLGISSFLRQLLPKNFDTADMIVVLLLLLMSCDGKEDNSALLTLALYLFL